MPIVGHSTPTLVVLAAGMGSRYGSLKQIDPVGPSGEAVLDFSVFDALKAGFGKVVFVIRRDMEEVFRAQVGRRFESRVDVRYSFQDLYDMPSGCAASGARERPWGTGHAVWCARQALNEPFAVINADDFYGRDAFSKLGRFLRVQDSSLTPPHGCMIGYLLSNTLSENGSVSRGICKIGPGMRLLSVQECTAIERSSRGASQLGSDGSLREFTGDETVSMNCWGFTPAFLPLLEQKLSDFFSRSPGPKAEIYLPSAVADMITRGEANVEVLETDASWFGVTYKEDRPRVVAALARLVAEGAYPSAPLSHSLSSR